MMIGIGTPNAAPAGCSLDGVGLNAGFARAVLEGLVHGKLWVDRAAAPRAVHALHPYGMSLVWGKALDAAAGALAAHLVAGEYRTHDEWLQVAPPWHALDWDALLGAVPGTAENESAGAPVLRYARVNFRFDAARFLKHREAWRVPPGWTARRMTELDFALDGTVVPQLFWRNASQFLLYGGGWCLEREGEVGAFAFASFRFGRELEIGIETRPAYRRQGLAQAVAAVMISDALAAGLEPVWSCRYENTASFELAQRLGFAVQRVLPYYRLRARRSASVNSAQASPK